MADFVLLYSGGGMPETQEEIDRVMEAWDAWYKELGSAIKNGGNPFSPAVKTVSSDGTVKEGAPGSPLTGYTIISAGSLDEAARLAKGSPVVQGGGSVIVYEEIEM